MAIYVGLALFGLLEWSLIIWFWAASVWFDRGYEDGYMAGCVSSMEREAKDEN